MGRCAWLACCPLAAEFFLVSIRHGVTPPHPSALLGRRSTQTAHAAACGPRQQRAHHRLGPGLRSCGFKRGSRVASSSLGLRGAWPCHRRKRRCDRACRDEPAGRSSHKTTGPAPDNARAASGRYGHPFGHCRRTDGQTAAPSIGIGASWAWGRDFCGSAAKGHGCLQDGRGPGQTPGQIRTVKGRDRQRALKAGS